MNVPVRVGHQNLSDAVRAVHWSQDNLHAIRFQFGLVGLNIRNRKGGVMVLAIFDLRQVLLFGQVELLFVAECVPDAGKIEIRSRKFLKSNPVAVKAFLFFQIADIQRCMF